MEEVEERIGYTDLIRCKEVETREVEGLLAKLLLALQNLSILTSLCVILIWCLILLYLSQSQWEFHGHSYLY